MIDTQHVDEATRNSGAKPCYLGHVWSVLMKAHRATPEELERVVNQFRKNQPQWFLNVRDSGNKSTRREMLANYGRRPRA